MLLCLLSCLTLSFSCNAQVILCLTNLKACPLDGNANIIANDLTNLAGNFATRIVSLKLMLKELLENEPLQTEISIVANDANILLNISRALSNDRRRHVINWKQVNAMDISTILALYHEKLIGEDIVIPIESDKTAKQRKTKTFI